MTTAPIASSRTVSIPVMLCAVLLAQSGCMLFNAEMATPATESRVAKVRSNRSEKSQVDLTLLTQEKPKTHLLGPGDTVNVYVQGVLPVGTDTPIATAGFSSGQAYYPPSGALRSAGVGIPLEVSPEGTLRLPHLGEVYVENLTISDLQEGLANRYVQAGIIAQNGEKIFVSLAKSRVHRVLVIREDADQAQALSPHTQIHAKRGRAEIVDLPAFENDVLHALAATGGLPGTDAKNEVWVLRGKSAGVKAPTRIDGKVVQASMSTSPERLAELERNDMASRIPLALNAGEQIPFVARDILLEDGDIVYVPGRNEYFYTAGLLPAGKFPLPRDEELDIVEAIALAGGSIGGFGGSSGSGVFQSGGLGGLIPPSLVAITRTLPSGEQRLIKVNLAEAMKSRDERVVVQPDDVIFLHYKSNEMFGNMMLNLLNFNFLVNPLSGM